MTMDNQTALSRISAYLRANMIRSNAPRVSPFTITFDAASDELYRNYAIPDDHIETDPASLMALICLFKAKKRTPRFEYFPELAPDLLVHLQWEGFKVERTAPVMAYAQPVTAPNPDISGIEWLFAQTPDEMAVAARVQNQAYGVADICDADIERLQQTVRDGGAVALVRCRQTGDGLGSGLFTPPSDGVTEIAAIGVCDHARRRGIGAAITAFLTRRAAQDGIGLPFLMAASEDEARIYARAGYQQIGTMTHISR